MRLVHVACRASQTFLPVPPFLPILPFPPSLSAKRLPLFLWRRLRSQLLDALLDAFGQLALLLQRAQRVACFLQHEFELSRLLGHVIDDGFLLAERLEVEADV